MAKRLPIITINGMQFYHDQRLGEARAVENPLERIGQHELAEYHHWSKEIQSLIGQTICHADLEFDRDSLGWYPYLDLDGGSRVYLYSDEEGNHGGRFSVQAI